MKSKNKKSIPSWLTNGFVFLVSLSILYLIYLILFINFRKSLVWYDQLENLSFEKKEYGLLTKEDFVQLGGTAHSKEHCPANSYLNFSPQKEKGKYRIGLFGCSFMYGLEAPSGFDMGSFLQKKYREINRDDIEIINFGMNGYGMNRSFYVWQHIALQYDLDMCIFTVMDFHARRDNSFLFTNQIYGPINGRYILDKGKPTFIPVTGENIQEAAACYFSPIQPWQYARYDAKTPPPFRALLPKGRELSKNPFYYLSDPKEEWHSLYTAIFDSVAKDSDRFLLVLGNEKATVLDSNAKELGLESMSIHAFDMRNSMVDFYTAPEGHPSALCYQLAAEEIFAYLQKDSLQLPVLKMQSGYGPKPDQKNFAQKAIADISLTIDSQQLASFMIPKGNHPYHKSNLSFMQKKLFALLDFSGPKALRFAPVGATAALGRKLVLKIISTSEEIQLPIATLITNGPFLHHASAFQKSWKNDPTKAQVVIGKKPMVSFPLDKQISRVEVLLGGDVILTGQLQEMKDSKRKRYILEPVHGPWICVRGSLQQTFDIHQLKPHGLIEAVVTYKDETQVQLPFRQYNIRKINPQNQVKISSFN